MHSGPSPSATLVGRRIVTGREAAGLQRKWSDSMVSHVHCEWHPCPPCPCTHTPRPRYAVSPLLTPRRSTPRVPQQSLRPHAVIHLPLRAQLLRLHCNTAVLSLCPAQQQFTLRGAGVPPSGPLHAVPGRRVCNCPAVRWRGCLAVWLPFCPSLRLPCLTVRPTVSATAAELHNKPVAFRARQWAIYCGAVPWLRHPERQADRQKHGPTDC